MVRKFLPWIGATGVFATTCLLRVVEPGFDNDHFRMMAEGRQVLLAGEAPYRDFADPGIFLQIYTSAALQWLFGYNLLGQALFGTLVLAVAMALTFLLARQASGSIPLAVVVTFIALALEPRLKQHHVVFLPILGLVLCWCYVDRPTPRRLIVAGLVTALAFLLRHDQGVYVGVAVAGTLAALHWRDSARVLLLRTVLYGAVAAAALLPFLAFLQLNGGIVEYFRSAAEYVRSEAKTQRALSWPDFTVDLSMPLIIIEAPPSPPPAEIKIRWAEGVTAEVRAESEQRYGLTKPTPQEDPRGRTWAYVLIDATKANVMALAEDPGVEDTAGIDRKTHTPTSYHPEPFYRTWWRSVPLLGLRVFPGVVRPANALPWLYYAIVTMPILAILVLIRNAAKRVPTNRPTSEAPKLFGAALMCLLMSVSLREPLIDRLADMAVPTAILAAWLLGQALMSLRSVAPPTRSYDCVGHSHWSTVHRTIVAAAPRLVRVGIVALLVGLTVLSVASLTKVNRRAEQIAMLIQHESVAKRSRQLFNDLRTSPPIEAPQGISDNARTLPRYVSECTKPTDRLLVTWFSPEIYFYADRRFAGRQLFWFVGYYSSPDDQARSVESLRTNSVPIIIRRVDRENDTDLFDQIRDYINENYYLPQGSSFTSNSYQILVDRRRAPTGRYEPLSLPCFS